MPLLPLDHLFGPSRDEIWRKLASELNAEYVEGDFWTRGKIEASHAGWLITLDEHGKYHRTRMRAPYWNCDGFRFTVYRKGVFSEFGKCLGMQDVLVGYPEFDQEFIIQGTDDARLRRIFANQRIRDLIAAQPRIHFGTKDAQGFFARNSSAETPTATLDVLEFMVEDRPSIQTIEQFRLLFDLFAETLDELCRLGTARKASIDQLGSQ